jgi:hypothetical protein
MAAHFAAEIFSMKGAIKCDLAWCRGVLQSEREFRRFGAGLDYITVQPRLPRKPLSADVVLWRNRHWRPDGFRPVRSVVPCGLGIGRGSVGGQIEAEVAASGKAILALRWRFPYRLVFSLVPGYYEIGEVVEKAKEEHCTPYQVVPFVGIKVAQVLDKAGGIITALATIAIAIVTFSLKRATDKLSDAGERQIGIAARTAELTRQQVAIAGSQTDIQIKRHARSIYSQSCRAWWCRCVRRRPLSRTH